MFSPCPAARLFLQSRTRPSREPHRSLAVVPLIAIRDKLVPRLRWEQGRSAQPTVRFPIFGINDNMLVVVWGLGVLRRDSGGATEVPAGRRGPRTRSPASSIGLDYATEAPGAARARGIVGWAALWPPLGKDRNLRWLRNPQGYAPLLPSGRLCGVPWGQWAGNGGGRQKCVFTSLAIAHRCTIHMGAPREYVRSTRLAAPLAQGVRRWRWRGWGGVGTLRARWSSPDGSPV